MKRDNSIIICADEKEQQDKRNAFKKRAKAEKLFVRVVRNTVVLNNGRAVTFVVEDVDVYEDYMPDGAFE